MKGWKRIFLLWSVFVCLTAGLSVSSAAERCTIRVGCVDIENFLVDDGRGGVSGYGAEYLNKIQEYTGWEYEYVHGTWEECMQWLQDGTIDLLFPAERTEEREKLFLFSESECCIDYAALLTRSDNSSLYFEDFDSFDGIQVGLISGNYLNDVFARYCSENGFSCRLKYFSTGKQLLQALQDGTVDAIVNGNLSIGKEQKVLAKFDYMPAYFIMHRESAAWMRQLNEALYRINLEDPYFTAQLVEKYYGQAASMAKSFTREEINFAKSCAVLRAACSSANEPFEAMDENSAAHGISVDLLKSIASRTGLKLEFVPAASPAEALEMVRSGQADLAAGICAELKTGPERNLWLTESYDEENCTVVARSGELPDKNSALTVTVPEDLIAIRDYLHARYPNWNIRTGESMENCLSEVENGSADLMIADALQTQTGGILKYHDSLTAVSTISCSVPVSVAVSRRQPEILVRILNKSIATLTNEERSQAVAKNNLSYAMPFSFAMFIRQQPILFAAITGLLSCMLMALILLFFRIRSRTVRARELQEKNGELRRANNAKTEFLSRVSHDMRTPMNGILGLLEIARDEEMTPRLRGLLCQMEESAQYLLGLINDTLDMNRIESRKMKLKKEPVQMERFLDGIADVIAPAAEQKGVAFFLKKNGDPQAVVMMDRLRVQQILMNVLSNAIHFTPEGGSITLCAGQRGNDRPACWSFVVEDTGIGMHPEFLPKIFLPFEQEETTSSEEGTGLGMAIVKKLVDLMNGSVSVESQPGTGTRVTVELEFEQAKILSAAEPEKEAAPEALRGKRVLLCEDNATNSQIVSQLLKRCGCETVCAANGEEGVERFRQSEQGFFDAILMDVRMPQMDGLEATRRIRQLDRDDARAVPVIAMTANAYDTDVRNCLSAGMNCHLAKPVNSSLLYRTLAEQIQKGRGDA
ncbi:MAG: transporter substrate-binding domain-containing protein [Firmicutes bacterium]|nr:transporter substrate-binding domain-containing protein [Bacillota bacterium]